MATRTTNCEVCGTLIVSGERGRLPTRCDEHPLTSAERQRLRRADPNAIRCSFRGCQKVVHARGLCNGHLLQDWRGQKLRPLRGKIKITTAKTPRWLREELDELDEPDPFADLDAAVL